MPLRPNIPSLFGIKLSVAVDFLCPTLKNKPNDSPTRDHFQLPIQAFSIVGDSGTTTGNFILYNFAQCKVRQIPKSGNFWSVESGTWKSFTCKIWNPGLWNLWFNSRNPESCWQLESRWKFHIWRVLQKAVPGMWFHGVESRIQREVALCGQKNVTDIFIKTLICFFFSFHVVPPKTATSAEIMYVTFFQSSQARSLL